MIRLNGIENFVFFDDKNFTQLDIELHKISKAYILIYLLNNNNNNDNDII